MAFKARVYFQRRGELQAKYIGEIDVDPRPIRNGRTTFTHVGKIEVGRIDAIDPPDWDAKGAIPALRVVQS